MFSTRRLSFCFAAIVLLAGIGAAWMMFRASAPRPGAIAITKPEIPIPEPKWGELENEAPAHVRTFRERLDLAKASSSSPKELAQAYGELGEIYLAYEIPASAVPCFQNASRLDRTSFRWPFLEAAALLALMDTSAAADAMSEAEARQRGDPATTREDRVAALCFLGEAAIRLNRLDDARGYFDEAIDVAPNCVFALLKRGWLASQAGDSEAAIDDFRRAMSLYQGAKPAPLAIALAAELQKCGQPDEAAQLRRAAALSPSSPAITYPNPLLSRVRALSQRVTTVLARARSELAKGDLQAACLHLDKGLAVAPDSVELRLLRGKLLLQMEQTDRAVLDLAAVCRDAPDNHEARMLLIQAYAGRPETREQARQVAVQWRDERPRELRPQIVLAAVDFQRERYEDAYSEYDAAARMFPQEISPRVGRIMALCAMRRYPEARQGFDDALTQFPDDADLQHRLARFLVTCPEDAVREPERGLAVIERLLSEEATIPRRQTLACALAACGRFDEAKREASSLIDSLGASEPSLLVRFQKMKKSFEENRPWMERWPFELASDYASANP